MSSPLEVTLYDKAWKRIGWIGDHEAVTVTPRHNQQPTASVQVRNDHPQAAALVTPGTRCVIDYHGAQTLVGVVESVDGEIGPDGSLTAQVQDAWSILYDLLGFPGTIDSTGKTAVAYDVRTGPAETVLKGYLQAAITRLGLPVTVAPDLGRGSTIGPVQMRFTSLAEQLVPLVDAAGVGVSVTFNGTGLVVDCYTPRQYPLTLTPESGIVTAASWSLAAPAVTRFVAGGQGDLTARVFATYVDTAVEASWGLVREGFVDATDVTTTAALVQRAKDSTIENAAKSGLSLTLAETDTFHYGPDLRVGDKVTTALVPGGPQITDVLREATISWTRDNGLTVTPVVGERSDDPDRRLIDAVRSLTARVTNIVTRR